MKYVIDIDGTICKEVIIPDSGGKKDYANHIPMYDRIAKVNALYDAGHTIKYMTARGCVSKIDYYDLTKNQLDGTKQIVMEMASTIRQLKIENDNLHAEIARLNEEIQLLEMQIKK